MITRGVGVRRQKLFAAGAVLVGGLVGGLAHAQPPATPVQVDAVRTATAAETLPVLARVVATQAGPIAARTAGSIDAFSVDVGDRLTAGEVIARLDRQSQTSQLAAAKAQLARARAAEALARQQLTRVEQLRNTSAFEESLLDQRRAELAIARADARAAEVDVASAQTDYDWATVRARFDGVITARHTNVGAWVARGTAVVDMVNPASYEIAADVPADKLRGIAPGQAVTVVLDEGATVSGRIRAIVPAENPGTRTRPVRVTVDDPAALAAIANNTAVRLQLPVGGTRDVLTVHKDAINRRGDSASVYVVRDGVAQPAPVTLGPAVGNRLTVLSGLAAGDLVVTRGNERLRPGQAVRFEPPAEAAAGDAP